MFPGVEIKNDAKEKQSDPSGKGLVVGSVINPESAISASRSSGGSQGVEVKQGPSQNFASLFNEAPESSGNVKPELRGVPQWGGGGGGGGGSFSGSNYYPINWLNANVYAIPRYTPAGILGFFTGVSVAFFFFFWGGGGGGGGSGGSGGLREEAGDKKYESGGSGGLREEAGDKKYEKIWEK